jgi:Na+-transporting NADH:ubiquinone oxidoreductase subunit F
MLTEITVAVLVFTGVLLALVGLILIAKAKLTSGGLVTVTVNGEKSFQVPTGGKLLGCLADHGILVPSACGGGGTCGVCTVKLLKGGGEILPTELTQISKREAREGVRLSCQVAVKEDLEVEVEPEVFGVRKWTCKVLSNRNVSLFIKELVLGLPPGESVDFKAGGYVQFEIPPHELKFTDFEIDEVYRPLWDKRGVWGFTSKVEEPISRAYSVASYPGEKGILKFDIRVALPEGERPENGPPGKASSYVFNLKPGDELTISGPYGEFFIHESDSEMIYVGRGAGMAPLRSHVYQLLEGQNSKRRISFWFNSRNLLEDFYREDFEALARGHPNFSYHLALSRPAPEDNWTGLTGYIAKVLYDEYLKDHPAPEDVEYYLCGPPVMVDSVLELLDRLGVEKENIYFDDFG